MMKLLLLVVLLFFFGVFARDREIADDLTMGKHCFRRCLTHFGEYKPLLSQPSLDSCIHLYKHLLEYTDDSSHNICIVKFILFTMIVSAAIVLDLIQRSRTGKGRCNRVPSLALLHD